MTTKDMKEQLKQQKRYFVLYDVKSPLKILDNATNFVDYRNLFLQIACNEGDANKGKRKCWIMAGITLMIIALTVSVSQGFHFGKIKGNIYTNEVFFSLLNFRE